MLKVSIVIPAFNEQEHIVNCLINATRQSLMPYEVIVVDNLSTDSTVDLVKAFIAEHPTLPVRLEEQDTEQGLIPTRNYGFSKAGGDILGRVDADCMIKPDWVEIVTQIFTDDPEAMGATGPAVYYDMPAKRVGLKGDQVVRENTYRADDNQVLLFGSNMAIRHSAWDKIQPFVCRDKADIMHEDIDLSLHLIDQHLKTVYSSRMITGVSARRMDTSFSSFRNYMRRFRNTFEAHPSHSRKHNTERTLYALYPALRLFYPVYQKYLDKMDIDPAERIWLKEQIEIAQHSAPTDKSGD